jgi:hypothetical protein
MLGEAFFRFRFDMNDILKVLGQEPVLLLDVSNTCSVYATGACAAPVCVYATWACAAPVCVYATRA